MKIQYYQNGTKLNDKQKNHFEKKLEKIAKQINNESYKFEVEIEKDKKGDVRAEIQLRTPGKTIYIGDEKDSSAEAAFDKAIDELKIQIRRDKEKRRTLQRRANLSIKKKFSIDEGARF